MAGFKRPTSAAAAGIMQKLVQNIQITEGDPPPPNSAPASEVSPVKVAAGPSTLPPVGSIIDVAPSDLFESPNNARQVYSQASITEIAESLKVNGQDTPVTGFFDERGRKVLIDGHRRRRGAIAGGLQSLRMEVKAAPTDALGWYLQSRRLNTERNAQTPLDDALSWAQLLERKVFASQAEISKMIGMSEAQVSKTLALTQLPPAVRAGVIEIPELLAIKPLYELYLFWKEQGDATTLQLLAEAASVDGSLSARDIARRRLTAAQASSPRPRSAKRPFSVSGIAGEIRRWEAQGRLELSIKGLDAETLADLEDRIARVVAAAPELPL